MKKRVKRIEDVIRGKLTPTQEKLVCRYLQQSMNKDARLEEVNTIYERVKDYVVRLH